MANANEQIWRILIVDDDEDDYLLTREMLRQARGRKIELEWASTYQQGHERLASGKYDAVLVDYDLGLITGTELIRECMAQGCHIPLILFTGRGSYEIDVEAMRSGATLYLTKSETSPLLLERSIRYAIERKQAETRLRASEENFRFIATNIHEILFFQDLELRYVWIFNPAVPLEESQVVGKTDADLLPPAQAARLTEIKRKVLQTGISAKEELQLSPGDITRWYEAIYEPAREADGKIVGLISSCRDITERKQAEEALAQHTNDLNAILSAVQDYVYIFDREGRFVFANKKLLDLWELAFEQVAGKTMRDLNYPPEVETALTEGMQHVFETGQVVSNITHYTSPSGAIGSYENILAPMSAPNGTVAFVAGSSRDITERIRTEEMLRNQASLLENISDAAISTDAAYNILSWNPAAERMYGWQAEEVLGKSSALFLHTEYLDHTTTADVICTLQEQGSWKGEVTQTRKDGTLIYIAAAINLLKDGADKPLGVVTINRDITERKQAEEALQGKERELQEAQRLTHVGNWYWNAATDVTTGSDELLRIYGVDPATQTMPNFQDQKGRMYTAAVWERLNAAVQETMQTGIGYALDVEALHNGQPIWVTTRSEPVRDTAGRIVGLRGTVQDITIRKRAEESLLAYTEQLQRSNQALEDFAFIASHDLQEPLRKVQRFGDLLITRYSQGLGGEGQDYIQRITQAVARMQGMLNGLLAYSQISAQGNQFTRVDLEQVVSEVLTDLEVRLIQTGGQVDVGALPEIEADPLQMRQLFQNLIGNALKFHRPGVPPQIKVTSTQQNDEVILEIVDNGIGFEMERADYLFKPFHRLYGRSEYEGTGMGLAICRKIVERHAGSITVASQPDQGTSFRITLLVHQPG